MGDAAGPSSSRYLEAAPASGVRCAATARASPRKPRPCVARPRARSSRTWPRHAALAATAAGRGLEEKLAVKPWRIAAALISVTSSGSRRERLGDDEVLEIYLDALAHVYDPHSDYLDRE